MAKNEKKAKFGEIAQVWLASKKGEVKASSYATYNLLLNEKILPKISGKKMKKLCKREFIEQLANEFLEEGYAKDTVENIIGIVKSIVIYYKGTIEGVAVLVDKSKTDDGKDSSMARKIIAKAKRDKEHTNYRNLGILIVMYTGITISELCALKWKNIHYEEGFITINEAVSRISIVEDKRTELVIQEANVKRDIPIHSQLARAMKPYLDAGVEDDHYVLTNNAQIIEPRTFQNHIKTFCKSFDKAYTASDMREMFIVTLLRKGVSIAVVAEIAGTTLQHICNTYGEFISVSSKDKINEMKKLAY